MNRRQFPPCIAPKDVSTPLPAQPLSLPPTAGSGQDQTHETTRVMMRTQACSKRSGPNTKVHPPTDRWYLPLKATLEFVAALLLLTLAAPVIGLAALAIKLTSRGPVFYSQIRIGQGGRPFRIFKLRTMIHDCEKLSGVRWAIANDPRITRVGGFLRRTHLDELPQLWNVLKGDMSLVGPRPERPEFVAGLDLALHNYHCRLGVRPGVTGLAQVHLPPDTDLESVRLKLIYDLYYIRYMNLWLDLRLICCTGLHLFGLPLPFLARVLVLPNRSVIEPSHKAAG